MKWRKQTSFFQQTLRFIVKNVSFKYFIHHLRTRKGSIVSFILFTAGVKHAVLRWSGAEGQKDKGSSKLSSQKSINIQRFIIFTRSTAARRQTVMQLRYHCCFCTPIQYKIKASFFLSTRQIMKINSIREHFAQSV